MRIDSRVDGSSIVPANEDRHVLEDISLAADGTLTFDLVTKAILPTFARDGQRFPADPNVSGRIVLVAPGGGGPGLGTTDADPPQSVIGIEGPYAIHDRGRAGTSLPRNGDHRLGSTSVTELDLANALPLHGLPRPTRMRRTRSRRFVPWPALAARGDRAGGSPWSRRVELGHRWAWGFDRVGRRRVGAPKSGAPSAIPCGPGADRADRA